jgi:hypothetical protein
MRPSKKRANTAGEQNSPTKLFNQDHVKQRFTGVYGCSDSKVANKVGQANARDAPDRTVNGFGGTSSAGNFRSNVVYPDLSITFYGNENFGKTFHYSWTTPYVRIGRDLNSELIVDDKLASRTQTYLKYIPNSGWVISEGDGVKKPTNPSWVFKTTDTVIKDGLVMKFNNSVFECKLGQNN